MAVFTYRGLIVASGKSVSGVRDADNPKVLRSILKRDGIILTEAHEDRDKGGKKKKGLGFSFFGKPNTSDIAMMTRQLATLVGAGIPLVEAVTAMQDQVEKEALRRVLASVRDQLNEGTALAKALEQHKVFPPLYVNMVAAGEASGTLELVLERLADFMENQARLTGKVTAALAYPVLMSIIGTALMSVMMIVVVPKVTSIFATLDRALPWYTQVLIFISTTLSSNQMAGFVTAIVTLGLGRKAITKSDAQKVWQVFAILALLSLFGFAFLVESLAAYGVGVGLGLVVGFAIQRFIAFLGTTAGTLWRDSLLLRLPIFGIVFRMLAVSRFSRTLSTLLKSGVPLLRAMEIVRHVLGNAALSKVVEDAAASIREGESIAGPLKKSGQFPPIVTHMIAVGEKSGQLETMLENVARAYDAQTETRLTALTSLLEPLIIVMMGSGVGFIAFSILMPLIQMNEFIQ